MLHQNKLLVNQAQKFEEIITNLQTAITQPNCLPKQRLKLSNMLATEVELKCGVVFMQRLNIESCLQSYEWFGQFKYSFQKEKGIINVQHGYQCHSYGNESLRMTSPLLLLPTMRNIFMQWSSTFSTDRFVFINGNPGDGKQAAIKIYTKLLGKFLFCTQLDISTSSRILMNYIQASQTGPFAISFMQKT